MVRAYWWRHPNGTRNFGDELSALLLKHYCGLDVEWASPSEADLVCAGSILDVLPQTGFQGIVAGSGKLKSSTKIDLYHAAVLGLRGRLTFQDTILAPTAAPVLGEPGLMASEMVAPYGKKLWRFGLVPHWSDSDGALCKKFRHLDPHVIDATQSPHEVLAEIGSCEKIIASSLHAIAAADSYHIPRRLERFPNIDHPYEGGEYKFLDYHSALSMPCEFDESAVLAPKEKIEELKCEIFTMLQEVALLCRA